MTRRTRKLGTRVGAALLAAALGPLACGADAPEGAPELFCGALCALEVECDFKHPSNRDACVRDCVEDRPGLANISVDGADHWSGCLRRLECTVLYDEAAWDSGLDGCWEEAQGRVAPSPRTRSFCRGFSAALFDCGYFFTATECAGSYGMWADAVLDQLSSCFGAPTCSDLDVCVEATFQSL